MIEYYSLGPANQPYNHARNSVAMNQEFGSTHQAVPTIISTESTGTTFSSPNDAVFYSTPPPPRPTLSRRARLFRRNGRCPGRCQTLPLRCRNSHLIQAIAMEYKQKEEQRDSDWAEGGYLAKEDMKMVSQHMLRCRQ
ncbi:MAG TPA: hypothetical protein VGO47_10390, partial [Chlamydiales bacterium]|nr:hypothetical protein [Chlamydiales bacterium]